ncbi:MAG: hypothetical protein M3Y59_08805 [Myxococcota bacterium]|nr:hypothetical protein [Myxococcota bacterium]
MIVLLLTVAVVALLMGGMALGLLRGRRLRGSCGGTASEACHCAVQGVPKEQRPCLRIDAPGGQR